MSKPITSRVKRSPLFKYSPLKQATPATAGGSVEGKDQEKEVTTIVKTPKKSLQEAYKDRGPEYKDLSFEEYSKVAKKDPLYGTSGGEKEVTTKKTVKGEDIDYEGTLQKATYGRVLEPWEINRLKRGTRKATNERNQASRKLDKNKGVEWDGEKYVLKGDATAKQRRDYNKQNDRYKQADATAKNQALARESGRQAGEEYYKGDRDRGLGEQEDPEQKAQFKRNAIKKEKAKKEAAERAAAEKAAKEKAAAEAAKKVADDEKKQKEAEVKNITTGQSTNTVGIDIVPISLGGGFGTGLDLYKQSSYTPSAVAMTKKGYSMKAKSPATKKLQGAQNTLPPHLQAAIKAAPGKMRGALKKGYFKNK